MSFMYFVLLLVAYQAGKVVGYSSGAPGVACTSLSPSAGHGPSTATGLPPYNFSLSASTYNPGDVIQVTLSGLNGTSFKGFLIVGKQLNGQTPVGVFNASTTGSKVQCPGNSGVTHTDNSGKTSVSVTWTAPSTPQGDVVFHYAVVRGAASTKSAAMQDYFQDIKSVTLKAVQAQKRNGGKNSRTLLYDNGPASGSILNAVSSFKKNTECGVTRGCFSSCQNNDCSWEVTWKDNGAQYNITIRSIAAGNNTYFALGFSNNTGMSPASVVSCIAFNGQVSVNASYTAGHHNRLLSNPKEGIHNETNSQNNGILSCSFSRDTISSNPSVFNLTDSWYLITAGGSVNASGAITNHGHQTRFATSSRINLSNSSTDYSAPLVTQPPTASTSAGISSTGAPPSTFPKDGGCGKTKGCYGKCSSSNCELLVSWQDLGSSYSISLTSASPQADSYIAVGFSNESKMNPASVLACRWFGASITVIASYNADYSNSPLSDPYEGLSNVTGSYVNGILTCSVTREATSTNPQIFNLTENWYIIAARGALNTNGNILKHTKADALVTTSRVNFSEHKDLSADAPNFIFVKAHGCLMVIAWYSLQVLVY